jgi:hypothetical protein
MDFTSLKAEDCKLVRDYVTLYQEALVGLSAQGITIKITKRDATIGNTAVTPLNSNDALFKDISIEIVIT